MDLAAAAFIHDQLLARRERGDAILLVSADLGELMALSDRILVMFEGRIVGEVGRGTRRTSGRSGCGWPARISPPGPTRRPGQCQQGGHAGA